MIDSIQLSLYYSIDFLFLDPSGHITDLPNRIRGSRTTIGRLGDGASPGPAKSQFDASILRTFVNEHAISVDWSRNGLIFLATMTPSLPAG
jgi:hypothetical protein